MTEDAILQHLLDIKDRLAAVETKFDVMNEQYRETKEKVEGIENSQNKLKWFAGGVGAVISFLISIAATWFTHGSH